MALPPRSQQTNQVFLLSEREPADCAQRIIELSGHCDPAGVRRRGEWITRHYAEDDRGDNRFAPAERAYNSIFAHKTTRDERLAVSSNGNIHTACR